MKFASVLSRDRVNRGICDWIETGYFRGARQLYSSRFRLIEIFDDSDVALTLTCRFISGNLTDQQIFSERH